MMSHSQDRHHTDRLTLEALLADPLTQLVMHSDNITTADVSQAFAIAQTALSQPLPAPSPRLPPLRASIACFRGLCGTA